MCVCVSVCVGVRVNVDVCERMSVRKTERRKACE